MDAIDLSIFSSRINAICDEMGVALKRAAFSPNIMDRLDFSCAIFDRHGELCAQAAHIPVHLGSMAYAMADIVNNVEWVSGDMLIMNDPYKGGTHLPDVTVIAPLFVNGGLHAFVANRAHHADIGAESPGSMPISASLQEEGLVIEPVKLIKAGVLDESLMQTITASTRRPQHARGDFSAQISANQIAINRLGNLLTEMGNDSFDSALCELNDYAERLARAALSHIPNGTYQAEDYMDDDGQGHADIRMSVSIRVHEQGVVVDFSGTDKQVGGNINCPLSVTASAVYYVFRCLMPDYTPACHGSFRPIKLSAPEGCLLNACSPAAVAAGNVETSTRVVDVILRALQQAMPERIPAASHGSMNNLAMGSNAQHGAWDYYETIGGGMGASSVSAGLSAVQTHMTNTLNTPVEVLENRYPVRVRQYALRTGSGGQGLRKGGDGLVRELEFLSDACVTLLTERRSRAPWGVSGGGDGQVGVNLLNGKSLPSKVSVEVLKGDCLRIETPGGGAWGANSQA